ncbi:MAG: HD-GYP domain-containing protein, partial [Peptococcales bacterium]
HERWDGEGYPLGLKGKEIPLISRIVNLADSFDAMTTVRPYKAGMSLNEALQELRNNANKQFDGKIVKVFNNLILKGKDLENGNEHNEQAG